MGIRLLYSRSSVNYTNSLMIWWPESKNLWPWASSQCIPEALCTAMRNMPNKTHQTGTAALGDTPPWIKEGRQEGNVLFNDALNTFYLQLYSIRHMVKDHSDSEKGNPLLPHMLLFPISSKGSFICTIPQTE